MGKVGPYYSDTTEDRQPYVYHDRDDCKDGRRIQREHWHSGTDNRRRCDVCTDLDR
jgi:hypothetical protein